MSEGKTSVCTLSADLLLNVCFRKKCKGFDLQQRDRNLREISQHLDYYYSISILKVYTVT